MPNWNILVIVNREVKLVIMKRNILTKSAFILLILSFFSLGGCSPGKNVAVDKPLPSESEITDNKLTITLKENPSTGYSWKYKMDKDGILELQRDEYIDSKSTGVVGAAGKHVWVFKGKTKGVVVITFKYYRPWEGEKAAIETKTFTVDVSENGKINSVEQKEL